MLDIRKIAKKLGINEEDIILYGNDKAKIKLDYYKSIQDRENGKLVLVTAITPTKAGEGKTTCTIGLIDGLNKIGVKALGALREPSLGPVFGLKGGAVGGGKASIIPSEDINLHFTGDMHALTSSINLISSIVDNHIFQGNELNIDPNNVVWPRALDINDRVLRDVTVGIGPKNGVERLDHFQITVASELMAILCLASDEEDFKNRVNNITVAYRYDGSPVYLKELRISNAIMKLMRYALNPNLVQTLEENPVIVHGGPFANIAHGCNSIIATKLALKLAPVVVTEAGFGADLGAEKFLDIKCRVAGLKPDATVLVATIRALKSHGGVEFENLAEENVEALSIGVENLRQHAENLKKYGVPVVIAMNHFKTDSDAEIAWLRNWCLENNYAVAFFDSFLNGGNGATELANKVVEILETKRSNFAPIYDTKLSIKEKIVKICSEIYRCDKVTFLPLAEEKIEKYEGIAANLPVCIAKTPLSFSDNPNLKNAPRGFEITVKDIAYKSGSKFLVVYLGNILTMPGLPKIPNAVYMEDENA